MSKNMQINVHHVTRVEGHGNIQVNVQNGKVEKIQWQVPEAPRFFEAMVRDRHYTEVHRIISRICGICSVGHTLASVKATEHALGMQMTPQTIKLRTLLKHAENFDSHVLHALFLVAPDLLGAPSVFPLVPTHGEVVKKALRLKRIGHEWGSMLAGRTTHPTRVVPGGFSELPTMKEIDAMRKKLTEEMIPDLMDVVKLVLSLADRFPKFDRPTEYMAVASDHEYGLYDGYVTTVTPDGKKEKYDVQNYRKITNEYVVPQSTAKYSKNRAPSYMAGALARFNNNFEKLHPEAKKLAEALGMKPLCTNPYLNTAAQVVEVAHSVHEGLRLFDEIAKTGIKQEAPVKPTRFADGASAVEVPRGILYHWYKYDKDGMCQGGDCIIPTNQNHANIQLDFEKLVPELLAANKTEKEMELALEMLVRAYDPCISCSTHYLTVKFTR
jgi:sulfhydrogenase subunit alpha